MNHGGLFLSSEGRLGSSCSRMVKDSSLTRKFKCVCVRSGWLAHTGLNGRLMDRGSEPDGLWGALFPLSPPVIHHISSCYWEIAVPLRLGVAKRQAQGRDSTSWLRTGTRMWLPLWLPTHSPPHVEAVRSLSVRISTIPRCLRACSNNLSTQTR